MKKLLFFLFALFASIAANAAVIVTPLSVEYSKQKVTFRVSWTGTAANDRAWVWVDLCPVAGTTPGTFAQAVISSPSAIAGSIATVSGNTRGFYVTTNPSTVTATLSNATGKFNWCVYGSDAPPNVTVAGDTYTLYGSPPFILTAADGSTTQTVAATSIATSAVTITPVTLTDQTGCPGVFCIYSGSDLYIDGTHLCQQRATGAKNWEAWIKDTRDDELYRIVLMPDTNWWLAQNVRYAGTGAAITISNCTPEKCGRNYTATEVNSAQGGTSGIGQGIQGVCPNGWILPTQSDWTLFFNGISSTVSEACKHIRSPNSFCTDRPDTYGWADQLMLDQNNTTAHETRSANDGTTVNVFWDMTSKGANGCGQVQYSTETASRPARCFRQL